MVAIEAAFIAAAVGRKKLGEHLLLRADVAEQPSFTPSKRPVSQQDGGTYTIVSAAAKGRAAAIAAHAAMV